MKKVKDLSKSIARSYFFLRIGLAVMAFAFPVLLLVGGLLAKVPIQGSMSAYYHATLNALPDHPAGQGVMRDLFVGILFAVGISLFVYQGVTRLEDYALNLAGLFALGIALFPMQWSGPRTLTGDLHKAFAICFFACIAYVAIFRARDTLSLISNETRRKYYGRLCVILGCLMIGLPIIAFVLALFPLLTKYQIFLIEFCRIYAFGAYWVAKTCELRETDFDRKAAQGRIRIAPHGRTDAIRPIQLQELND
jgi:hypothetical protein